MSKEMVRILMRHCDHSTGAYKYSLLITANIVSYIAYRPVRPERPNVNKCY